MAATTARLSLTTNIFSAWAWLIPVLPLLIFGVYPALLLDLANGAVTTPANITCSCASAAAIAGDAGDLGYRHCTSLKLTQATLSGCSAEAQRAWIDSTLELDSQSQIPPGLKGHVGS